MDKVHTMWNWVVCSLLTAIVVVRAECPENAQQKAQLCTANLGIGPPIAGPNPFVQQGQVERAKTACREGLFKQTVSCLRELSNNCTGNTDREHILRSMVDPDQIEKSVNYFCKNLNIYEANAKCIEEAHPEQTNCTHEVKKNFRTKAMATANVDVMMTSTCRFFSMAVSCSSRVLTRRCGQSASNIVKTILKGFEPPKCREMAFDEGTYTVSDDDDNSGYDNSGYLPSGYNIIMYVCVLLCHYVDSWRS